MINYSDIKKEIAVFDDVEWVENYAKSKASRNTILKIIEVQDMKELLSNYWQLMAKIIKELHKEEEK
jgi:hypothetical protein